MVKCKLVFCQHCTGVGRGKMCIEWFVTKVVGVHLDPTLNLDVHFNKAYKKAAGRVNLLRRIRSNTDTLVKHWKCPYRLNFYFLIRSYISCNEPWRKNFSIWIFKKAIFLWVFKDLKILFSCGLPVPLITWSTCSELWRRFRNLWFEVWIISRVLPLQI